MRQSFSTSSFSPCTTRSPRLTLVSEGTSGAACSSAQKQNCSSNLRDLDMTHLIAAGREKIDIDSGKDAEERRDREISRTIIVKSGQVVDGSK